MGKAQPKKTGRETSGAAARPMDDAAAVPSGILPSQAIRALIESGGIRPAMAPAA
jgi:hypothetical protein